MCGRKLGAWVKWQRYQYKNSKEGKHNTMTEERIRLLKAIGFTWSPGFSCKNECVAPFCFVVSVGFSFPTRTPYLL